MRRTTSALLLALLGFAFGLWGEAPQAAAADLVKVGLPGRSIGFTPWFVGKDFGIFKKNGINVVFVHLAGNALPAALVSNGIQATPLLSEVIAANFAGYKVKAVGLVMQKAPYMILAAGSVSSVRDLKGKTIVSSPPKGLPNVLMRYFLAKAGLNPDKDAKLLFIGSEAARRTIILDHKADAIIEDVAHGLDLEQKMPSLRVLVPSSRMPDQATGAGLGVADSLLEHDPDLVTRMLRSLIEIKAFMKRHPGKISTALAKELGLPLEITRKSMDMVNAELSPSLVPGEQLFADDAALESLVWGKKETAAEYKSAWDTRLAASVQRGS